MRNLFSCCTRPYLQPTPSFISGAFVTFFCSTVLLLFYTFPISYWYCLDELKYTYIFPKYLCNMQIEFHFKLHKKKSHSYWLANIVEDLLTKFDVRARPRCFDNFGTLLFPKEPKKTHTHPRTSSPLCNPKLCAGLPYTRHALSK